MLGALAAGAMLPIFTGGRRIANLKLKKVQYDKVLNKYMKTNLTAIQEVNDALVSVKKDTEKMAQTKNKPNLNPQTLCTTVTNSMRELSQNLI